MSVSAADAVPAPCAVRDKPFLSSHFVIGDVGSVCGSQASRLPYAAGSWKRRSMLETTHLLNPVQVITWLTRPGIIQCIASDASRRSIFAAAVFLCFYGIGGGIGVSILFKSLSKGFVVADAHSGPVFFGGELEVKSAGPCLRRGTFCAHRKYPKMRKKPDGFLTSFPVGKRVIYRTWSKLCIDLFSAPLPLTL